jgi:hypothetical protein
MVVNRNTSDEIVYQFADVLSNNLLYEPEKYPAPLNSINRYGLQKAILYWYAENIGSLNQRPAAHIRSLNESDIRNIFVMACLLGNKAESLTKRGVANTVVDYKVIDEIEFAWTKLHHDPTTYWENVERTINEWVKIKYYARLRFPLNFVYLNECDEPPLPETVKHLCTICSRENPNPTIRRQTMFESIIQWRKQMYLGELGFADYIFPIKRLFDVYRQGRVICLRCNVCGGQILSEASKG